ncbi:hypothetical protein ACQ4PT_050500 [Festuca glaucescens]
MAAAADEKARQTEDASSCCSLYRCLCSWRRACSPRIPRVAPGRDYLCIPAGADDSPAWSVLVGLLSGTCTAISDDSVLGLHRFRVARSGRILGGSDDALDILHTVRTTEGCSGIASAAAALTPDGRSLCLFSEHLDPGKVSAIPRAHQLRLTYENPSDRRKNTRSTITTSALPRLPSERPMRCRPVSAAGHLWAPNIELELLNSKCVVGMLRLDRDAGRWEKAGDAFAFPLDRKELTNGRWVGPLFQGYAVLHDDTILVSLRADQGLLTFSCSDCTWTQVTTTKDTHTPYIPILGRGIYIKQYVTEDGDHEDEDDGTVYFLRDNKAFAHKLCYYQDQEDQRRKLKLEPPAMIDFVCPFGEEGYGFLTHLGGRLMCSVWISTLLHCSCQFLHVLITTFRVRSTSAEQKGIDIVHSTCRRLDVFPVGLPMHEFCFLHPTISPTSTNPKIQPNLHPPSNQPRVSHLGFHMLFLWKSPMLDCCRNFLSDLGYYKFEEPPEDPALQINKDLYIICQAWPWVAERMCLDCAYKYKISDAIIFCVVQGEYCYSKSLPGGNFISHDVHITTVEVKTERVRSGKRKPERIDHVDIGTCFIEHDAALVCTTSCFAVGP